MNHRAFHVFVTLCLILVCAAMVPSSGCAARSAMMVPASFEVVNKHAKTVQITESVGGRETHPLWTSQISNSAFTEALANAVAKSQVFQSVVKGGKADYILDVTILKYDQPLLGADFDIKMKTRWELTDSVTHKLVWSDTIDTTYKARLTDALVSSERLQKANEGAVRTNIAEGIKRLSRLQL